MLCTSYSLLHYKTVSACELHKPKRPCGTLSVHQSLRAHMRSFQSCAAKTPQQRPGRSALSQGVDKCMCQCASVEGGGSGGQQHGVQWVWSTELAAVQSELSLVAAAELGAGGQQVCSSTP